MKATYRLTLAACLLALIAMLASPPTASAKWDSYHSALGHLRAARALIDQYCTGCHNDRVRAASLVLTSDKIDIAHFFSSMLAEGLVTLVKHSQ